MRRLWVRKSVEQVRLEAGDGALKRVLGPVHLTSLGIGSIIGAGIFVMTGNAAANFAGPAILVSFLIAGSACVFAALCYAELASTIPAPGSAYTYCYATMGEVVAWLMGWLLLLEFGISASAVAIGWAGYVVSLLRDLGIVIPPEMAASTLQVDSGTLHSQASANIVSAIGILGVAGLLVLGISQSATVTSVFVIIKVTVLLAFVALGIYYIDPENWTPFVPRHEGAFAFGWPGILRAASMVFFAYVGFESISTAAAEAKSPQRDLPIGILGSLLICTLIYLAVATVLTGVVPYRELGVPDPIAIAVDRMNPAWAQVPWDTSATGKLNLFSLMIKLGAVSGLFTVMLVHIYAQSRVFFAMARDGLLPSIFGVCHPVLKTPWIGTLLLGVIMAIGAALLPLRVVADVTSIGTSLAFAIVCGSVLYLRRTQPHLERPFKVPFYPLTPIVGVIGCLVFMMGPILADVMNRAFGHDIVGSVLFDEPAPVAHDPTAFIILSSYLALGALVYIFYGYRHSRLGTRAASTAQAAQRAAEP